MDQSGQKVCIIALRPPSVGPILVIIIIIIIIKIIMIAIIIIAIQMFISIIIIR